MDQFLGEIRAFPFNFAPKGWALCNGQLLAVASNTALFSILGTTYGGNGKTSFALPNLPGYVVVAPGQGPGLSLHDLGETGGSETVSLLESEIPTHSHTLRYHTALDPADTNVPSASASFAASTGGTLYQTSSNSELSGLALVTAGGDQPHNNMQPYLTLNFCIALQGVYPPRT